MERNLQMPEIERNWAPPAELTGSREIRLAAGGYASAVLAVLLLVGGVAVGIILHVNGNRRADEQARLQREGKDVEATILRVWRTRDKEQRRMVAYQFEVEGRQYGRSVKAPREIWNGLTAGSVLAIHFLPSDPGISSPRDWPEESMPAWVPFLAGTMLSLGGAGLGFLLKRQMRLLREGQPAPAVVTKLSYAQHGKKMVHYEFRMLDGSLKKGKSGPGRRPPAIGATVCVLYDRDNPRRSAIYPLDLVRVEKTGQ